MIYYSRIVVHNFLKRTKVSIEDQKSKEDLGAGGYLDLVFFIDAPSDHVNTELEAVGCIYLDKISVQRSLKERQLQAVHDGGGDCFTDWAASIVELFESVQFTSMSGLCSHDLAWFFADVLSRQLSFEQISLDVIDGCWSSDEIGKDYSVLLAVTSCSLEDFRLENWSALNDELKLKSPSATFLQTYFRFAQDERPMLRILGERIA